MKSVLQSEFAYIRTTFAATIISFAVVYIVLYFSTKLMAPLSALCAMEPLLFLFTFASADAANGWGRFRAALPVSPACRKPAGGSASCGPDAFTAGFF